MVSWRVVAHFIEGYNTLRLHSAICYISPKDQLEALAEAIFAERDANLPPPGRGKPSDGSSRVIKKEIH